MRMDGATPIHDRVRCRGTSFPASIGKFGRSTDRELLKSADGEGLTLICKNTGDWTDKLYSLAQGGGKDSEAHAGRNVTVLVDGPYGT